MLSDRLAQDPHLSAALHEVLSVVSAIRSTAAILAEGEEIAPEWRVRFHANMHADAERLAAGAEALVAYLDASGEAETQGSGAPQEEVEAWLQDLGWRLEGLEPGAGAAARAALEAGASGLASGAARVLARRWLATGRAGRRGGADGAASGRAGATGPDPVRLADLFGVDVIVLFRRLALVPGRALGRGDLRRVRHDHVPPRGAGVRAAAVRGGLCAVAALHGAGPSDGAGSGEPRDVGAGAAAVPGAGLLRATPSAGLRRPAGERGGDADRCPRIRAVAGPWWRWARVAASAGSRAVLRGVSRRSWARRQRAGCNGF